MGVDAFRSDGVSPSDLAALGDAIRGVDKGAARLLTEVALGHVIVGQPEMARLVAAILSTYGSSEGRSLSKAIVGRIAVPSSTDDDSATKTPSIDRQLPISVDVLVLSVKRVEFRACLRAFGVEPGIDATFRTRGQEVWVVDRGGVSFAIAYVGTDGNVESALKMCALWSMIRFRLTVLVGMAAGVKKKVELGDVVVAEAVWAAEFRVIRKTRPSVPRPKTYDTTRRTYSGLTALDQVDPFWGDRVRLELLESSAAYSDELPPDIFEGNWKPNVHTGVVFAGSQLVEDGSLPGLRESQHGRLLAAEMEGAGFAAACRELSEDADWLVVRGIADFGQVNRAKNWQFAATYAAAALLRDGISSGRISLPTRKG